MKIIISNSAKSLGDLYHFTGIDALNRILLSGNLGLASGRMQGIESQLQNGALFFASFTRSRTGYYHYSTDGKDRSGVIITLDGTRMSDTYKFASVDYWSGSTGRSRSEAEERLLSDKQEIPILKFIKSVDFVHEGSNLKKSTLPMSKYKVHDTGNREGVGQASALLRLKKYKIPYKYFSNMKDWAFRRNEYSDIGPKTVHREAARDTYSIKYVYPELKTLFEALTLPYDKMDKNAQELCKTLYHNPTDALNKLSAYQNAKSPKENPVIKDLVGKIARSFKRFGLQTEQDFAIYVGDKYKEIAVAQRKQRDLASTLEGISIITNLMTKPISELSALERNYLDPERSDMFTYVLENLITRIDQFEEDYGPIPQTLALHRLVNANILNAHSIKSEIGYARSALDK